jgi:hypothetical protein
MNLCWSDFVDTICPNADLMSVEDFQRSPKERADEREESVLRDVHRALVNRNGFVDGWLHKIYGFEKI